MAGKTLCAFYFPKGIPRFFEKDKDYCYRLMKDARFSRGQPPYFPAFRAHLTAQRKRFIPVGYYISLQPEGRSFISLGLAASNISMATAMIRSHIASHSQEWIQIVENHIFAVYFSPLRGEKYRKPLKNMPAALVKNILNIKAGIQSILIKINCAVWEYFCARCC